MYLASDWKDYEIIDAGGGNKHERWADVTLLRPDPQAVWPMKEPRSVHARYIRSSAGGGHWEYGRALPESWKIRYRDLTFFVRPTGFQHTGLFPEQAVNWDWMRGSVEKSGKHQAPIAYHSLHESRAKRILMRVLAAGEVADVSHHTHCVLINGEGMKEVMLHLSDNVSEFGQE